MAARFVRRCCTASLVLVTACYCVTVAQAQMNQNLDSTSRQGTAGPIKALNRKADHPTYGQAGEDGKSDELKVYNGQIYCPVTGHKLGVKQPAVPVQTSIGEKKPGAIAGLFGKKATPGVVIYVCCPACAEKVKQAPEHYLGIVIGDQTLLPVSFTYTSAPAERPDRPRDQR
jgi:hypothetical protein